MKNRNYLLFLFLVLFFLLEGTSCVQYKKLVLMSENEQVLEQLRTHSVVREAALFPFEPYRIRPFDQLMIRINAFDGSTEEFLNREFSDANIQNSRNINFEPASLYFNSYTVNESGQVNLPIIEQVQVTGLTLAEVKVLLDSLYLPYLKFASTNIKLANMRVTILGEVTHPGLHYLYNEKNTILDALSLAGNSTPFANLRKVKLIRLTETGTKTVFLDMTAPDFVYSEYFFARPYDILYLEPVKAKAFDSSSESVGVVLSTLSIIVLLANIFLKK